MKNCSTTFSFVRYFTLFIILTFLCTLQVKSSYVTADVLPLDDVSGRNDKAANSRSDSIDILHTHLSLDLTDFTNRRIRGWADLRLVPKKNGINALYFDLLELNVDSVFLDGVVNTFFYNDTLIKIPLSATIGTSDTVTITVYYSGSPVKDNSWGGFYYQGNYAFNLGVAFTSSPHNYGRVWFPCFDNFVERCSFSFAILTADKRKAHCNGELTNETTVGIDSTVSYWEMKEEIPSYLACVAVADYQTVKWSHQGVNKKIPVEVAAREVDTSNVKNSFAHLNDAIDAYEFAFGPYLFNKVGYSIVPFNSGAMEHATNIAYPRYAVDGSLNFESLMAHELSHHWWGDLVTCRTDGDMWINEGMASYCEHLFTEYYYGKEQYLDEVKENLTNVLQYAHIREQQYRAITNLPHEYTYGMHTYDKGAVVAYNLRTYLGDSLFYNGCSNFLSNHKFQDVSSTDLKNDLEAYSGKNLSSFFSDWVFKEGFSHFSIDSIEVTAAANDYDVRVYLRQKLKGAPAFFNNVPIALNCYDANMNKVQIKSEASGQHTTLNFLLPFEPVFIDLNPDNYLNLAMTSDLEIIKDTGSYNFKYGKMEVNVNSLTDSALIQVVHNWVSPDPLKNSNRELRLSDYRYWTVDGIINQDFDADATIYFDGRNMQTGGNGHLDFDLLRTGEDSLLLMYRPDNSSEWTEFRNYKVNNLNSISDRYGSISIFGLKTGQYTLAKGQNVVGMNRNNAASQLIKLYPNPNSTGDFIHFSGLEVDKIQRIDVVDMQGKLVRSIKSVNSNEISVKGIKNGVYFFNFKVEEGWLKSKVVLTR